MWRLEPGYAPEDVAKKILPLVGHLAHEIPLRISTIFSQKLLPKYDLPRSVHCSDLEVSDRLFDSVNRL